MPVGYPSLVRECIRSSWKTASGSMGGILGSGVSLILGSLLVIWGLQKFASQVGIKMSDEWVYFIGTLSGLILLFLLLTLFVTPLRLLREASEQLDTKPRTRIACSKSIDGCRYDGQLMFGFGDERIECINGDFTSWRLAVCSDSSGIVYDCSASITQILKNGQNRIKAGEEIVLRCTPKGEKLETYTMNLDSQYSYFDIFYLKEQVFPPAGRAISQRQLVDEIFAETGEYDIKVRLRAVDLNRPMEVWLKFHWTKDRETTELICDTIQNAVKLSSRGPR